MDGELYTATSCEREKIWNVPKLNPSRREQIWGTKWSVVTATDSDGSDFGVGSSGGS